MCPLREGFQGRQESLRSFGETERSAQDFPATKWGDMLFHLCASGKALGLQREGWAVSGRQRLAASCPGSGLMPLLGPPLSLPGFLRLDGSEVASGFLFLCSSGLA